MDKSVAIIVCAWPPQGGGIGNNAYYQANKLAERGWKVGVFTPDFSNIQKSADGKFALRNLPARLHIGKAGFLSGLHRELKAYGIIHLYYPFFGTDLLVWLYKKINPDVKLVLHYEMDPVGEGIRAWIFRIYIKLFLGLLVGASDKVAVLSFDHARNSYLAPFMASGADKFIELPNGIDAGIFKPGEKDEGLMKLYNFSVQDKILLFVGGLDRQHYFKGLPVLLEAFKELPVNYFPDILDGEVRRGLLQDFRGEAKLLIVGDGDLRAEFEAKASELGISDRVVFTGWVKNEDLPKYYRLADIFILPSTAKTESFGIVVAEAQACGRAAIVANWPGVRSTLIDNITGLLVKPGDRNDLASKIKLLLYDEKLRRKMGEAGHDNATIKYDWDKLSAAIESIYSEL